MKIEWLASPNYWQGRTQKLNKIVYHWWNDPKLKPTLNGTVAYLRNSANEVSAHYVVSGDRIIQLVKDTDTAWHALTANPSSIGIEIDPQVPGNTYKTVGWLVNELRKRHGNLPLKKHSDYVATQCPGTINLTRVETEAKGEDMIRNLKDLEILTRAFGGRAVPNHQKAYVGKGWNTIIDAFRNGSDFKGTQTRAKAGTLNPKNVMLPEVSKVWVDPNEQKIADLVVENAALENEIVDLRKDLDTQSVMSNMEITKLGNAIETLQKIVDHKDKEIKELRTVAGEPTISTIIGVLLRKLLKRK